MKRRSKVKIQKRKRRASPKPSSNGNGLHGACVVPDRIESRQDWVSVVRSPEHERREVRQYLWTQAPGEKVTHLEKVTTEVVAGERYDVWDVETDKNRWWVVTPPTNLYLKSAIPSLDICLSFHVGLMARVFEAQRGTRTGCTDAIVGYVSAT